MGRSISSGCAVSTPSVSAAIKPRYTRPAPSFNAALPARSAAPIIPASNVATSPIKGTATLTDAQIADLNAGKWYFNVHTAANPGGEIRGTVMKQ